MAPINFQRDVIQVSVSQGVYSYLLTAYREYKRQGGKDTYTVFVGDLIERLKDK